MIKSIYIIIFICLAGGILMVPLMTQAQIPSLIPEECRGPQFNNECGLSQVEELAIRVAQIIIGFTGSIALLMFVIGGIMYVTSGGNGEKIKKANSMLINSVIGLAIIMFAGLAIRVVLRVLTGDE